MAQRIIYKCGTESSQSFFHVEWTIYKNGAERTSSNYLIDQTI